MDKYLLGISVLLAMCALCCGRETFEEYGQISESKLVCYDKDINLYQNNEVVTTSCRLDCNTEHHRCTCEANSDCESPDNAKPVCSDGICDFSCNFGYIKSELTCEPIQCKENDTSDCVSVNHAKIFCNSENKCDFNCDDGYIKTSDDKACELEACDNGYIKIGDECFECTEENTSHCAKISNATVSCKENACQYACDEVCYTWNEASKSCEMIDINNNGIPDCYDAIDCDDKDIICLNTADDFLHLPDYFDDQGKVKSEYGQKYKGKSEKAVFYLMNDIHLSEIVETSIENGACKGNWKSAPSLKNLVLKTPLDRDKRIDYQAEIDGKEVRCKLNSSLWKSLDNSNISHLKIDFDVESDTARAALVEDVSNSEMHDVSYSGQIHFNNIDMNVENLGGIVGKSVQSKFYRVYCDGASISGIGCNLGCVIGAMEGGVLSNETEDLLNPVVNRVVKMSGMLAVGGLIGMVSKSAVVKYVTNVVEEVDGVGYVGGFIGLVSDSEVMEIDNISTRVSGMDDVGGLIGNVYLGSHIHDVVHTMNLGVTISELWNGSEHIEPFSFGGFIGSVHGEIDNSSGNTEVSNTKIEIYNIEQNVKNDNVMVQANDKVGGLIGSIQAKNIKNVVSIHDVKSQMGKVIGTKDYIGGMVGVCLGELQEKNNESQENVERNVSIYNVKNEVNSVEKGTSTGSFVGKAENIYFENVDNQFTNVICNGSCGGFAGRLSRCYLKDIRNRNIAKDESVYSIYGVFCHSSDTDNSEIGASGFAHIVHGTSEWMNIDNEVNQVQSSVGGAAGFVSIVDGKNEKPLNIAYVTNQVDSIDGGSKIDVAGFVLNAGTCSLNYIINTIHKIEGKQVGGFAGTLELLENLPEKKAVDFVQSTIDRMIASNSAAGFSLNVKGMSAKLAHIRSIVHAMEVKDSEHTAVGFSNFGHDDDNDLQMSIIVSAVSMKSSVNEIAGAVYWDNPKDGKKTKLDRFVTYLETQVGDTEKRYQVSTQEFIPVSGSSIRYYTPGFGYSPTPGELRCGGVCEGFPTQTSVDNVVSEFNTMNNFFGGSGEKATWEKTKVEVGEKKVEMPTFVMEEIGFHEPEGGLGYQGK